MWYNEVHMLNTKTTGISVSTESMVFGVLRRPPRHTQTVHAAGTTNPEKRVCTGAFYAGGRPNDRAPPLAFPCTLAAGGYFRGAGEDPGAQANGLIREKTSCSGGLRKKYRQALRQPCLPGKRKSTSR